MNLISKLFIRQKVECPRCLGKGMVDSDDIRRLNKDLLWKPGKCAYCNGLEKVSSNTQAKVRIDNTYLTTDLPEEERNRLINGEEGALKRANAYENRIKGFIMEVEYLYFIGNLDEVKIADFYLLPKSNVQRSTTTERDELIDYVKRIIENKKKSGDL